MTNEFRCGLEHSIAQLLNLCVTLNLALIFSKCLFPQLQTRNYVPTDYCLSNKECGILAKVIVNADRTAKCA